MTSDHPWIARIKKGDVLRSRSGFLRIVRKVDHSITRKGVARPCLRTTVIFAIQHCSWTSRCYTVYTGNDLVQMGYEPVAWGQLIYQLTYKAESAGRWVVPVNPRGTSIRCSGCGEPVPKTLVDRQHNCKCGVSLDRDHNAALNILALGMSVAGESLQNVGVSL